MGEEGMAGQRVNSVAGSEGVRGVVVKFLRATKGALR